MAWDIVLSGEKSVASDNRRLASAYIPSGNTRLQNIGVYASDARRTPCFHMPNNNSSGIHHVAQAHITSVTPSMNGRIEFRKGMLLLVRIRVDPALVAIAAAPMITHNNGVISSGVDLEEEYPVGEERDENAVEGEPDAPQHMDQHEYRSTQAA